MQKRIAILISGRGSNMEAIAKNVQSGILKDCCEIALVFSNNPDAQGLEIAKKMGIKTEHIESKGKKRIDFDTLLLNLLEPYKVDYIILAGFMRILSPLFIERYRNRIINIHPADTNQYKGIHGYEWAFSSGLNKTQITVHLVEEQVDCGKIIAQRDVDLTGLKSIENVIQIGLCIEHQFYSEVLKQIFTNQIIM